MRRIDSIVVHCSDTPNNRNVTVEEIRDWHVNERGWDDIGYHFIIYRNGALMMGRPVPIAGAHCYGHNGHSIGVCLIGRDEFTKEQFNALRALHKVIRHVFGDLGVYGHRDLNKHKTCPNFDVKEVLTN
jgi:hypothetical protein